MSAPRPFERTALGRAVNSLEETVIAFLLGAMTLVTFVNVVLRYGFNTSLIWGLEVVLILFAWLVLFGIAYGFKITSHLGVDAITNMLPPGPKRVMAIITALLCLVYVALLAKGAWDYWAPFAGLQQTTGRWFPTGITEGVRSRAFYTTDQVPMPAFLSFIEPWTLNRGFPEAEWEHYEKLPRVLPYAMLPFAAALMLLRVCQALYRILRGTQDSMIVSHEAEDAVEEAAAKMKDA
ncbi:TRAP transporter small permease [Oceaniglobus trochenteri]|uniref:TRAP transporter small permease n=1 Tax=Oceaniglobus trochenteri TaxID=2763260 RepID=UPI001CFFFA25|nr:TRAP transporter small permease [Oceaniglobus trochenteri]